LWLQNVNQIGAQKYDPNDRPLTYAFEAEEIAQRVLGSEPNYIVAKTKAQIGKVYLVKGEGDKAETIMNQAYDQIVTIFEKTSTLAAKYNQNLVEAYNIRSESQERTDLLCDNCEKIVLIC